ncbi:MAG: hypothetical protein AB7F65_07925 [Dehalococcoidia bacterium]
MLVAILQAVAGILILLLNIAFAEPVSLGGLLGVLLLVSALIRYVMHHDGSRA